MPSRTTPCPILHAPCNIVYINFARSRRYVIPHSPSLKTPVLNRPLNLVSCQGSLTSFVAQTDDLLIQPSSKPSAFTPPIPRNHLPKHILWISKLHLPQTPPSKKRGVHWTRFCRCRRSKLRGYSTKADAAIAATSTIASTSTSASSAGSMARA